MDKCLEHPSSDMVLVWMQIWLIVQQHLGYNTNKTGLCHKSWCWSGFIILGGGGGVCHNDKSWVNESNPLGSSSYTWLTGNNAKGLLHYRKVFQFYFISFRFITPSTFQPCYFILNGVWPHTNTRSAFLSAHPVIYEFNGSLPLVCLLSP